jgi:tripartite-type tricarboxylate transporter receptor subunit TctC
MRTLKLFLACAMLVPLGALAQAYPAKTLRVVVPFPPGGGVDIVARALSEKLSPRLGQSIVIENKPGAGTQIGTDAVAKSAPDGYTLLVGPIGSQAIVQLMHAKRNFDFRRDLAPVARIGHGTIALIVPASSKAQSVKELVALAKKEPGRMTFASSGAGALIHLTGELFKQQAGIDMTHVPYKGTTQILPDLLDGRVDMALDSLPAYLTHLKSGRVRALAVASPQRSAQLPEVPTMAEVGLPKVLSRTDYAVYAPIATPKEAVALLNREINAVLKDEDLRAKLIGQGIRIEPGAPEEITAEFNEELEKWGRVMREANIKPES